VLSHAEDVEMVDSRWAPPPVGVDFAAHVDCYPEESIALAAHVDCYPEESMAIPAVDCQQE
jgi:hypothetical protein